MLPQARSKTHTAVKVKEEKGATKAKAKRREATGVISPSLATEVVPKTRIAAVTN